MCGIIGCVGPKDARRVLYDGLQRLEYRGYDSAGIAVGAGDGLAVSKAVGRVAALDPETLPLASFGLAHTRWATHGQPTEENAHPHVSCGGEVAVVHNGIIENHVEIRKRLEHNGHTFRSQTDTEIIAHLIEEAYDGDIAATLEQVTKVLKGSFAIVAAHRDEPGVLAAMRHESPLVVGVTDGATYVASDVVAFREHTDQVIYLEDGDVVRITADGASIKPKKARDLSPVRVPWKLEESTLTGFDHFMIKEIHDQPRVLHEALLGRTTAGEFALEGDFGLADLASKDELVIVACGSSYNAACAAAHLFEDLADMSVRVILGSEYEPRRSGRERTAVVAVTQSGETADTLNALRAAKAAGFDTYAVANVVGSTATRVAHAWVPIRAGPEVSVAATKSFSTQLLVLHTLALQLASARGTMAISELDRQFEALRDVPNMVRTVLDDTDGARAAGQWMARHASAFVLGRATCFPVAMETALKIKEISYIHAEGFAAGELKHGPLALIEDDTPTLAFVPAGPKRDAILSNMREVAARGGRVVAITDDPEAVIDAGFEPLPVPRGAPSTFVYPALVLGQLISYHAAVARGCEVDRPRNLAKSVTVG